MTRLCSSSRLPSCCTMLWWLASFLIGFAAQAQQNTVQINEVVATGEDKKNGWVELYNSSDAAVSLEGWKLIDQGRQEYPFLDSATIGPKAYLVVQEKDFKFSLSAEDALSLMNGDTTVDSFSWRVRNKTSTPSYARCPDLRPLSTTHWARSKAATANAANSCYETWPGDAATQPADAKNTFGDNLSGLVFEPHPTSGQTNDGVLWAVQNSPPTLYRLSWNGTTWSPPETGKNWAGGKKLLGPSGSDCKSDCKPDCKSGCKPECKPECKSECKCTHLCPVDPEGVTKAEWEEEAVYVSNETSNPGVLRYATFTNLSELGPTHHWDLSSTLLADLRTSDTKAKIEANKGLEAITWVPDSQLTQYGFKAGSVANSPIYNPADQNLYPNHGTGLFFVGLEANGRIYAFALNHEDQTHRLVASFDSGLPEIMGLEFDRATGLLWAYCDNSCENHSTVFEIETLDPATKGQFQKRHFFDAANLDLQLGNNEGIAIAPECSGIVKPFFWVNDGPFKEKDKKVLAEPNQDWLDHALMKGTIPCGPIP